MLCQGQHLPKRQATTLYSLLGTRFGGNDQEFFLPDLTAVAPKQFNYYMALQGVFPVKG